MSREGISNGNHINETISLIRFDGELKTQHIKSIPTIAAKTAAVVRVQFATRTHTNAAHERCLRFDGQSLPGHGDSTTRTLPHAPQSSQSRQTRCQSQERFSLLILLFKQDRSTTMGNEISRTSRRSAVALFISCYFKDPTSECRCTTTTPPSNVSPSTWQTTRSK
jgi:hypothetical protein